MKRDGVWQRRAGSGVTSAILNDGAGRHLVPGLMERSDPYYTFCHLDDRMGNTNHLSDASGNVLTSTLETDAFGVETYRANPGIGIPTRSGLAGAWGYENEGGGINLVGHRWYDADAGRFLTRDPARQGSNWWKYCANDPGNRTDPSGLDWYDFFVAWGDHMGGGEFIEPSDGRRWIGNLLGIGDANNSVHQDSNEFEAGTIVGIVHEFKLGFFTG